MKIIKEQILNFPIEIIFYIGQHQNENFDVIDLGSETDLWFHSGSGSSCHVVLKLPENVELNKKQMQLVKKRGAVLCKQNTSKLASQKKVEIIYTYLKHVQKTSIPGQVITENTKSIVI